MNGTVEAIAIPVVQAALCAISLIAITARRVVNAMLGYSGGTRVVTRPVVVRYSVPQGGARRWVQA